MVKKKVEATEPAHSFMYAPRQLMQRKDFGDTDSIFEKVSGYLKDTFNEKQKQSFCHSFQKRLSLLWGPPGTGKTTVLAGTIMGWLEYHMESKRALRIGVGSSNYNAIDNVLTEILTLIKQRGESELGHFDRSVRVCRVRSDAAEPPLNDDIEDIPMRSKPSWDLKKNLQENANNVLIVGGTWQQLGKLAKNSKDDVPTAQWFDLLVIDEASQVPVAAAAAYFLLLNPEAHVILAGDDKQLGPIYGFQIKDSAQGLFDCIFSYMLETHEETPVALEYNYRTNVEIADWPKERFYSEGYESFSPTKRLNLNVNWIHGKPDCWPSGLPWSDIYLEILDPHLPVVVISYSMQTFTLSNPFEAQILASLSFLYKMLWEHNETNVKNHDFWSQKLGIVTPHRAQMSTIRNLLVEVAGMPMTPPPFVDTVDRFQGQERDLILSSYVVADKDFVASEESFILNPRRFNVTLTRARSKFIMLVSDAILQYLPSDPDVARDASHLQLFAEIYCQSISETIEIPYFNGEQMVNMKCHLRGRK